MAYSIEEQETILNYDALLKVWQCYSAVPFHIETLRNFAEMYNMAYVITSEGCIRTTLPKQVIAFKKPASAGRVESGKKLAALRKEKLAMADG